MWAPQKNSTQSLRRGVTVIELLIAMFILSLVAGVVVVFQRNLFSTSRLLQNSLTNETQVRKLFSGFSAEVRSALPAWNGASIIDTAGTSTIIFYTTVGSDKYTSRIRYQLVGTNIVKGIAPFDVATGLYDLPESTSTVATGVVLSPSTNLFTYYDKTYDGTSTYPPLQSPVDIASVRLVRFDLPSSPTIAGATSTKINSVEVTFRNLKDNY